MPKLSNRHLIGQAARQAAHAKASVGIPLSQTEVAALLRITPQTVHAIEQSALKKLRTAADLAEIFFPVRR